MQSGVSLVGGGGRVTECIGPRGLWGARDRLLAIGNTGTFHSNSGPNAETKSTSPILGAVFKLQRMRNRIKQILQNSKTFSAQGPEFLATALNAVSVI